MPSSKYFLDPHLPTGPYACGGPVETPRTVEYAKKCAYVEPPQASILDEAKAITEGARQKDYGSPKDNHARTAAMFDAWRKGRESQPFTLVDVCAFNLIQKLSRLAHTQNHHDSIVDLAGWAENWAQVIE